jgi:hypothetical protein
VHATSVRESLPFVCCQVRNAAKDAAHLNKRVDGSTATAKKLTGKKLREATEQQSKDAEAKSAKRQKSEDSSAQPEEANVMEDAPVARVEEEPHAIKENEGPKKSKTATTKDPFGICSAGVCALRPRAQGSALLCSALRCSSPGVCERVKRRRFVAVTGGSRLEEADVAAARAVQMEPRGCRRVHVPVRSR